MHFKLWNKEEPSDLKMQMMEPFKQKLKTRTQVAKEERSNLEKGKRRIKRIVMAVEKEEKGSFPYVLTAKRDPTLKTIAGIGQM